MKEQIQTYVMFKHNQTRKRVIVGYDVGNARITQPLNETTAAFDGKSVKQMKNDGWEALHQWQSHENISERS